MTNNKKTTHSPPLSEEELKELAQQEFNQKKKKMFSTAMRSITKEINKYSSSSSFLSKFSAEQVSRFLENPVQYEKQLRQLSNYLYNISGNYKNIIQYFALLPKYAYTVEPYVIPDKIDKEKYKKAYFKNLKEIEKMNLRHELIKAMKIAFKEDVFYGYTIESKDSFFIMNLNADDCVISSIEEGVYNFAFDFSYFDRNKDALESFPEEFRQKHLIYQANRANKFIELDSTRTICLKVNEELTYPLIPFSSIFESVFDHDDYKKIKKQKTKMDNFLLLTQKIPQGDKNEIDQFTINLELAGEFHDLLSSSVPDGISVALSPMDIQPIRMEKSRSDADTIAQAQRDVFSAAGVPQDLFNSEKNSAAGINKAITVAENISFGMLRQIERWVNRRLERMSGQYKFHIKFLDITSFNEQAKQDQLHRAATSSLPMITEYAASLGMSPLDLYNKAVLENDVLGLHDMLRPLASSYTQSNNDGAGRDKKDDADVSEATEKWRETDNAQGEI
jgi:hypothetical protein